MHVRAAVSLPNESMRIVVAVNILIAGISSGRVEMYASSWGRKIPEHVVADFQHDLGAWNGKQFGAKSNVCRLNETVTCTPRRRKCVNVCAPLAGQIYTNCGAQSGFEF